MHSEIEIREILDRNDPALQRVEALFADMYEYMAETGLNIGLSEKGASTWLKGVMQSPGRFGILCIAEYRGEIIGFAHGSIRLTPDYLGSRKLGVITHIFVMGEYRNKGVGEALVLELEKWFKEKGVHSVELQVLANNRSGIAFWEKLGYPAELNQHRKAGDKI